MKKPTYKNIAEYFDIKDPKTISRMHENKRRMYEALREYFIKFNKNTTITCSNIKCRRSYETAEGNFHKDSQVKGGYHSFCKICRNMSRREDWAKSKD